MFVPDGLAKYVNNPGFRSLSARHQQRIRQLQAEVAMMQTARQAYANALKASHLGYEHSPV